jgi:Holliday junction resolvase
MTRSAGSKGAKDVVAAKVGALLYIQCKRGKEPISVAEWNRLIEASEIAGAIPLLATRKPNSPFQLFRLLSRRKPRSRTKPMEPFSP